jgi:hypothetical protein
VEPHPKEIASWVQIVFQISRQFCDVTHFS